MALGGTGVSPVRSVRPSASGNPADGRPLDNKLGHPHGLERRTQPARPPARPDARTAAAASFVPSRRAPSSPGRVAGFLGHGHFGRGLDFATYEGYYPLQIP